MKQTIILALLAVTTVMYSQTAKVVMLDSQDAAEAKALYAQQDEIAAKIKALEAKIKDKYLLEPCPKGRVCSKESLTLTGTVAYFIPSSGVFPCSSSDLNGCSGSATGTSQEPSTPVIYYLHTLQEWEYGFAYSDDFKFIVPVSAPTYSAGTACYAGPLYYRY